MIFAVVTRHSDRPYHTLTTGGQYEPEGKLRPDAAAAPHHRGPTQRSTSAQVLTDVKPPTWRQLVWFETKPSIFLDARAKPSLAMPFPFIASESGSTSLQPEAEQALVL